MTVQGCSLGFSFHCGEAATSVALQLYDRDVSPSAALPRVGPGWNLTQLCGQIDGRPMTWRDPLGDPGAEAFAMVGEPLDYRTAPPSPSPPFERVKIGNEWQKDGWGFARRVRMGGTTWIAGDHEPSTSSRAVQKGGAQLGSRGNNGRK